MGSIVVNSSEAGAYKSELSRAAAALAKGALVVFPTETVYGIAASASHPQAMKRLREIKQRTDRRPFTIHLPSRQEAAAYVDRDLPFARRFARKVWPGPLTLVCAVDRPQSTGIATTLSRDGLGEVFHDGHVGLRCPDHPVAHQILKEAAVPIVASSANGKGAPPPTSLEEALASLGADRVDVAIDAGPTRLASASTIVRVEAADWTVVRTGAIDQRTLERVATNEILMVCTGNTCRSPMAEYMFRVELARQFNVAPVALNGSGYRVSSAGTAAAMGSAISEGSSEQLTGRGIDASSHRAQPLTMELVRRAERIYAMSLDHRARLIDLSPAVAARVELLDPTGSIADPIGGDAAAYARCAAQIEQAVRIRVKELIDEDRNW
jgi:protein-tyrosine phosphatase